jgi:hypothetical protein
MSDLVAEVNRQRRTEKLSALADTSIEVLRQFISGTGEISEDELHRAKYASVALGAWAKFEQSSGARDALSFAMSRELASNPEELQRYVTVSMPHMPLVKALGAPAQNGVASAT